MEIGRLCVKLAGRDAEKKCVVVDIIDEKFVMIDGSTRRRKCNIIHLEPLDQKIDIKKGASHDEIAKAFEKIKLPVWNKKAKPKTERPKKIKKKNEKAPVKKVKKKEEPKKEEKEIKKQEIKKENVEDKK